MTGHGGTNVAELEALGLTEADVLDLSVNVVPFELQPQLLSAMGAWDPRPYPDPGCQAAKAVLAERFGVPSERVVLGNGATELMWTLFDALKPERVLSLEPTFSEFRAAGRSKGVQVLSEHDPTCEWPDVEAHFPDVQVVYLTHPNNPMGRRFSLDRVEDWARARPEVLFLLDESFLGLSEAHRELDRALPLNVVRLRSLTKDFGLAGLRVGYALASGELAQKIEAVRPPWTINGLAQAVVPAALAAESSLEGIRARLFAARDRLSQSLNQAGFSTQPSSTIYVVADVGDASRVKHRLLSRHAIRVRDCTNFGCPRWIRVAAREGNATERLIYALREEA
ncbi:MAG: aminotransferase class I/II-fold pyridoxal phosphate-dependent enzyme [Myxococcota bacterium]